MPHNDNGILPGGTGPGFTRVTRNDPKVRVRMPNGEIREMSRTDAEFIRNAVRFNQFVNQQRPVIAPNDPTGGVPVNRDLNLPDLGKVVKPAAKDAPKRPSGGTARDIVNVRMPNGEVRQMTRNESELMKQVIGINKLTNRIRPTVDATDPLLFPINRRLPLPDFGKVVEEKRLRPSFDGQSSPILQPPAGGLVPESRIPPGTEFTPGGDRLVPREPELQMRGPTGDRLAVPPRNSLALGREFSFGDDVDPFIQAQQGPVADVRRNLDEPESPDEALATAISQGSAVRTKVPLAPEDQRALEELERLRKRDQPTFRDAVNDLFGIE